MNKPLIRFEIHTHTNYSKDSILNKYFYLIMLKLKKISVIGITDHNEIEGVLNFKKFLKKFNIKVIIGEEIFTTNGEIIGLFLKNRIPPFLTPEETIKRIKAQEGIVYIPHPYDEKRYKTVLSIKEIAKNKNEIDIIECHNGRNINYFFSEKQDEIADEFKKLKLVGSDAHTFIELGRNFNIIEPFDTKEEFLKNLKNVKFQKKDCLKISHQITKLVKIIKLLRSGEIDELFGVIRNRCKKRK